MTFGKSARRLSSLGAIGALALAACLAASPLFAASLDISGTFGDEAGCRLARGEFGGGDGGTYLTANGYGGWEWYCSFSWVSEGEDFGGEYTENSGRKRTLFAWTVIALCGSDGAAWPELLAIQDTGEAMVVTSASEPTNAPTVLKQCPAR